jgi:hypothetical protein
MPLEREQYHLERGEGVQILVTILKRKTGVRVYIGKYTHTLTPQRGKNIGRCQSGEKKYE